MIPANTQPQPAVKSVIAEKVGVPLLWIGIGAALGFYLARRKNA
jgi:hypothetical protein